MVNKQIAYKRGIQKHLYFSGELSCLNLTDLTGKSFPLTNRILSEMIEEGTIIECGYAHSTGGRRAQMYSLNPDLMMYVVAVAMDQLITRIAIFDMMTNTVGEEKKIELELNENSDALKQIASYINEYILSSGIPKHKIAGIGIGMPGLIDVTKGVNYTFLKTGEGKSIVKTIELDTDIPVLIDNDSSLIALAELKFGAARNLQNVMVINIGWGVGLGMIVKGELFRGNNGFAGEFSHIPLFTNNKLCNCGKFGCLETETSLLVVTENAIKGLNQGELSIIKKLSLQGNEESIRSIMEAALHGDKFAIELLSVVGYNVGRGVAILIHLLNPERIILSGRGGEAGKVWLAPIQQAINEHCIPKIAENITIEISSLGYCAGLIGAAALVMEHYDILEKVESLNIEVMEI